MTMKRDNGRMTRVVGQRVGQGLVLEGGHQKLQGFAVGGPHGGPWGVVGLTMTRLGAMTPVTTRQKGEAGDGTWLAGRSGCRLARLDPQQSPELQAHVIYKKYGSDDMGIDSPSMPTSSCCQEDTSET